MKFETPYWVAWVVALTLVAVVYLFGKGKAKDLTGKILLVMGTAFIFMFAVQLITNPDKLSRATAKVGGDQAELSLRVHSALSYGQQMIFHQVAGDPKESGPRMGLTPGSDAYKAARKALEKSIKQAPDSALLKARLLILLAQKHNEPDLQTEQQLTGDLLNAKEEETRGVGEALSAIYLQKDAAVAKEKQNQFSSILEKFFGKGWYLEHALLDLYQLSADKTQLAQLEVQMQSRYEKMFVRFLTIIIIALGSGLIGVLVILFQAATAMKKKVEHLDEVGMNVSWRNMYSVFVGWFCTQLLASFLFHSYSKRFPTPSDPLATALFTTITYLVSNGPALFFIYQALKAEGLPFFESLRLKLRTSTAGPFALVVYGYLGWCAAFPLVLVSGRIATELFGTQGSDNPVISQIVQAASSPNIVATLLFYITLGVLAPFFEEMLFRGFFYGALKPRIGPAFSMIASAALFACMHFDKGGVLMLFTIGFVLAFLFERTRSLVPSMIAHGLWNSGSFTLAMVLFGSQ